MVKWIILAILLLPLAEIAAFILVAVMAGLGWALILMLATTLTGFLVLRWAGRGRIARFRVARGAVCPKVFARHEVLESVAVRPKFGS